MAKKPTSRHKKGTTKTAKAKKTGRPTKYTLDLAEGILERLSSGESLTSICAAEEMPKRTTVVGWQGQHDEFATSYARARIAYADAIFDEAIEISSG